MTSLEQLAVRLPETPQTTPARPPPLQDLDRSPPKSRIIQAIRSAVGAYPELAGIVISFPAVLGMTAFGGGIQLFVDTWNGLISGDAYAQLLVFCLLNYGVIVSLALHTLREGVAANQRAKRLQLQFDQLGMRSAKVAADTEHLRANVDTIQRGLRDVRRSVADLSASTSRLALGADVPRRIRRENSAECWDALLPETEFFSVAGRAVLDVECEWQSSCSELRLTPNIERLSALWLPRFAEGTALKRVTYVLFVPSSDQTAQRAPECVAKHLVAFRTLKAIARSTRTVLHLDRARFVIKVSDEPRLSVFIGTKSVGGVPTEFVNNYIDFYADFGISFMEETVETSFEPEDVRAAKRAVRALISAEPQLTLEDLEARFGDRVPMPALHLDAPRPPEASSDPVFNGDHFTI